jgi:hypothetical protein
MKSGTVKPSFSLQKQDLRFDERPIFSVRALVALPRIFIKVAWPVPSKRGGWMPAFFGFPAKSRIVVLT